MLFALLLFPQSNAFAGAYQDGVNQFRDIQERYYAARKPFVVNLHERSEEFDKQRYAKESELQKCPDVDCARRVGAEVEQIIRNQNEFGRAWKRELIEFEVPFGKEAAVLLIATLKGVAMEQLRKGGDGFTLLGIRDLAGCENYNSLRLSPAVACMQLELDYKIGRTFYRQTRVWHWRIPNLDPATGKVVYDQEPLFPLAAKNKFKRESNFMMRLSFFDRDIGINVEPYGQYYAPRLPYGFVSSTLRFEKYSP